MHRSLADLGKGHWANRSTDGHTLDARTDVRAAIQMFGELQVGGGSTSKANSARVSVRYVNFLRVASVRHIGFLALSSRVRRRSEPRPMRGGT
jgi:hypothetical protein